MMENTKKTACSCSKHHPPKRLLNKSGKKTSILNVVTAVVLFLFPKCPICWAAYASLFSFLGLEQISFNSNWSYIVLGIFLVGSFFLMRKHYLNKSWSSLVLYGLGMVILMISYGLNFTENWWLYVVLGLIVLSNLSSNSIQKIIKLFKHPFAATT